MAEGGGRQARRDTHRRFIGADESSTLRASHGVTSPSASEVSLTPEPSTGRSSSAGSIRPGLSRRPISKIRISVFCAPCWRPCPKANLPRALAPPREEVETAVTSYGRWLLEAVFDDDTTAALDGKSKNPVWLELVRRAGGPTLRVSRHLLYVAVTIAANDKRITDQAWRGLDGARKELLLPLRTSSGLREAAQHVAKFNLTQAKTREYVTSVLEGQGEKRQVRLTAKGLLSRVRKRGRLTDRR
jgi:hypothetical protein